MSQAVVVIAAHAFEARAMASVGRGMTRERWGSWMLHRGELWELPLAVVRCGPGKVAAAAAAQAAVQYLDPGVMISFGAAGCPARDVKVGTLAVAAEVVDVALAGLRQQPVPIPVRFHPDRGLMRAMRDVPGTLPATLLCWEGHVTSPDHVPPSGLAVNGLVAVDWESAAVAQVAEMWGVPWAALRVVSDHGERERLKLLAVVAKRHLEWGAEVVRRACDAYFRAQLDTLGAEDEEGES